MLQNCNDLGFVAFAEAEWSQLRQMLAGDGGDVRIGDFFSALEILMKNRKIQGQTTDLTHHRHKVRRTLIFTKVAQLQSCVAVDGLRGN